LMLNQTITGIEEDSAAGNGHVPSQPLIVKTYPNPFNGVATFSMTGSIAGGLTIDIYNILGQQVYSIRTSEGRQHIEWQSGNNPSGMYFYCARSGQNTINGKFVLLK
jgi:hypothetical protein